MGRFISLLCLMLMFLTLLTGCLGGNASAPVSSDGMVASGPANAAVSEASSQASTSTAAESASAAPESAAAAGSHAQQADTSPGENDTSLTARPGTSAETQPATESPNADSDGVRQDGEFRAVWISYYELDGRGKNGDQFRDMVGGMFDKVKEMGLNTVVVHIRANADAFYPSSFFPWCEYAAGTQGQDPGYDPLAIMIEEAHARRLAFHAWLNPYRVSNKSGDPLTLCESNPARVWLTDEDASNDDWAVCWGDGIYYNPGVLPVQKLILDGVREILDNYAVDGIHFDDYFYPTTDPGFDSAAYGRYTAQAGECALPLGDWRRANVNSLMQAVYRLAEEKGVPFGISPSAHVSTDGSDKNYNELYADIARWMGQPGYIHYIAPQLYFGFAYPKEDFRFDRLLDTWLSLPRAPGVRLYVGLPAYKIGTEDAGSTEWLEKDDILKRQLALLRQEKADGFLLYSYSSLVSDHPLYQTQMENLQTLLQD